MTRGSNRSSERADAREIQQRIEDSALNIKGAVMDHIRNEKLRSQERALGYKRVAANAPAEVKVGEWVLIKRPRTAVANKARSPQEWPPRKVVSVDEQGHVRLEDHAGTFKQEMLVRYRGNRSPERAKRA